MSFEAEMAWWLAGLSLSMGCTVLLLYLRLRELEREVMDTATVALDVLRSFEGLAVQNARTMDLIGVLVAKPARGVEQVQAAAADAGQDA
jgi:hypothetical protein